MRSIQKLSSLKAALITTIALTLGLSGTAGATGTPTAMTVSGQFHTIALTCPAPNENDQCVIDQLSGGLTGTNKLITVDYTENNQFIIYHDATYITTQYGGFTGDEYGIINKTTGAFTSVATLHSNDGCGSTLTNHNEGAIDLDTLEDSGRYNSVLVLKKCRH